MGWGRASGPMKMASIRPRGSEIKSIDVISPILDPVTAAFWDPRVAGTLGLLNPITVGTQSWNRIGRKVELLEIDIRGTFTANPAWDPVAADFHKICTARFLLVWDAVNNSTTPLMEAILRDNLNSTGGASAGPSNYLSGQNRDFTGRFTILMDFTKDLPAFGPSTTAADAVNQWGGTISTDIFSFHEKRSLRGLASVYTGAVAALANQCQTGALWLLCIGNWAYDNGATPPVRDNEVAPYDCSIHTRLMFKDA